nr:hypothetical protein [Microcystis aeruginosa]
MWYHSFNQCAWCVPQKSIGGAVGVILGNAPYKIGDRTEAIDTLYPRSRTNSPFWLFVTWYGSIGGHKLTKSLSGKRLN